MFDGSDIGVALRQNDEVESARQFGAGLPKGFPDKPFPAVADDGIAGSFRNGKSQSAVRKFVGSGKHNDRIIGGGVPGCENLLKLTGTEKTERFGEMAAHNLQADARNTPILTNGRKKYKVFPSYLGFLSSQAATLRLYRVGFLQVILPDD